jgi:glycosyltransferase involved in cell wall biosynthesis
MSQLPPGTWVVVPCYDAHHAVTGLVEALSSEVRAVTVVVDDGSDPPLSLKGVRVLRHARNRGYGAAQKTGYAEAIQRGAERVVLLHGDAQYPIAETLDLAHALDEADAALGSRFLEHAGRNIPWWRRWGNRFLTGAANARFGVRVSELHSGARAFRTDALRRLPLGSFSDDYVFDQQVLVGLLAAGASIAERPLVASYNGTVQSIGFRRSVKYGLGCLAVIARGH